MIFRVLTSYLATSLFTYQMTIKMDSYNLLNRLSPDEEIKLGVYGKYMCM